MLRIYLSRDTIFMHNHKHTKKWLLILLVNLFCFISEGHFKILTENLPFLTFIKLFHLLLFTGCSYHASFESNWSTNCIVAWRSKTEYYGAERTDSPQHTTLIYEHNTVLSEWWLWLIFIKIFVKHVYPFEVIKYLWVPRSD